MRAISSHFYTRWTERYFRWNLPTKKAADRSPPLDISATVGASAVHVSGRRAALMPHAMRCARVMTPRLVTIDARRRRLLELGITHAPMVDAEHAFHAADHTADRRSD